MSAETFPKPIVQPLQSVDAQTRMLVALLDLLAAANAEKEALQRVENRILSLEREIQRLRLAPPQDVRFLNEAAFLSDYESRIGHSLRGFLLSHELLDRAKISSIIEANPTTFMRNLASSTAQALVKEAASLAVYSRVGIPVAEFGLAGSLIASLVTLMMGLYVPAIPFLLAAAFSFYSLQDFRKKVKPLRLMENEKARTDRPSGH